MFSTTRRRQARIESTTNQHNKTIIIIILYFSTNTRRPTENPRQVGPEQFVKAREGAGLGRQNISSRFSAALEQPLLTETVSEKMRTPR